MSIFIWLIILLLPIVCLVLYIYIKGRYKSISKKGKIEGYLLNICPHLDKRIHHLVIIGQVTKEETIDLCDISYINNVNDLKDYLYGSVDVFWVLSKENYKNYELYLRAGVYWIQGNIIKRREFTFNKIQFPADSIKQRSVAVINFSNNSHYKLQTKHSSWVLKEFMNSEDCLISFSEYDFDEQFWINYDSLKGEKRGFMYWCWKPACIAAVMQTCNAEYILYCDSATKINIDRNSLTNLMSISKPILAFRLDDIHKEYKWAKGDCITLLLNTNELDTSIIESPQICATVSAYKRTEQNIDISLNFIQEWAWYCRDRRLITDDYNRLGENLSGFIDHRHDQSIFSLLLKLKYKIYCNILFPHDKYFEHHAFG